MHALLLQVSAMLSQLYRDKNLLNNLSFTVHNSQYLFPPPLYLVILKHILFDWAWTYRAVIMVVFTYCFVNLSVIFRFY